MNIKNKTYLFLLVPSIKLLHVIVEPVLLLRTSEEHVNLTKLKCGTRLTLQI